MKVYNIFFEKFSNIKTLAKANVSDIEITIRRLGFQKQRARQFKEMARTIVDHYDGKIPSDKESLLRLSGVGDYVANAVLCFAFNRDVPIVDMNVRRVVRRFFGWKNIADKEIERRLSRIIPKGKAKQFNWGIIDFSSQVCSRKPKCNKCFLSDLCSHLKEASLA